VACLEIFGAQMVAAVSHDGAVVVDAFDDEPGFVVVVAGAVNDVGLGGGFDAGDGVVVVGEHDAVARCERYVFVVAC
jgi:hypothetical protein